MVRRERPPLKVGDIVLISEDNVKRGNWPLAIVEEVHKGKDGLIRTSTLRTKLGKRRRPVQKLYLLEEALTVEENIRNNERQSKSLPKIIPETCYTTNVHTQEDKEEQNYTKDKDLLDSRSQGGENVKSIKYTRLGRPIKAPNRLQYK